MKERPILFGAPMVQAILAGRKCQTRRAVRLPLKDPDMGCEIAGCEIDQGHIDRCCPYGHPGDRLWVRETFCPIYPQDSTYNNGRPIEYDYRATYKHGDRLGDLIGVDKTWKPSIFMPRSASRITLEITGIRVERLQGISAADAITEGCEATRKAEYRDACDELVVPTGQTASTAYRVLWETINGAGSWDANPWVWVVGFRRLP